MAAPFNLEDLAKLKSFVEFVAANPAILNTPQLYFLKKLIEQLGGKVPEGTFQMPAGAKCPFGGDVKSESKSTPPPASADEDEEEMPDMEAESEESEVELDMEDTGTHQSPLEPIHYMEEKPLKIVENLKTKKRKSSTKKTKKEKSISKRKKSRKLKRNTQLQGNIKLELETSLQENSNDPLFTPQTFLKCELNEAKIEPIAENEEDSKKCFNSDDDKDFCFNKYSDEENDDEEEEYEMKTRKKVYRKVDLINEDDDEFDDDDEPLTRLQEKSVRGTYRKSNNPRLKDCPETCKQKCTFKYDMQQRLDIYHFYWQLSELEKVDFLRTHVRKPVIKYLNRQSMRSICCYYLKHYKIDNTTINKETEEKQSVSEAKHIFNPDDEELTKVCRMFFTGTLKCSDQEIKEAIKDFELIPERIKRPFKDIEKDDMTKLTQTMEKKTQQPQQYLDPETGNLTDTKPKNQKKYRKRNEAPPKKFPKPIRCSIRCKFKCHEKFTEEERKQICDVFWSLDYRRRKDFVLSRIEIKDVKTPLNPEYRKTNRPTRSYQTRYHLRLGPKSDNIRVCKHFMENTLSVNKGFIENAIEFTDKMTGAYTSFDRRGKNVPHNKISDERKQTILDHINSYPYWIPNEKSKIKCLHYSLSIKKMFDAYKEKCVTAKIEPLPLHYYYKVFHANFRILFLTSPNPKKGRGYYKTNPNICHYTGEESGGCWVDVKGNKLDLQFINPALTLDVNQQKSSILLNPSGSAEGVLNLAYNPLETLLNSQQTLNSIKSDVCPVSYENLSNDSINML